MDAAGKNWISTLFATTLSFIDRWAPFLLLALALIVILPGLGDTSLLDWDESIYAQVAREMIQSNDWVNLHHGYQPYFEKPPLLIWAIAVSYELFGINEFAARLPSAISGVVLVYVTYLCGRAVYGNRTGFLAGLILLSSFGFVYQSRNGTTNMPLTLFVFLGIFAYLRLRNGSQKWWYLFFASFALAFMVKFWAALILPGVVFLIVLIDGKLRETLRSKHFWWGVGLAAVIVLPWHILVYLESGQAFLDSYFARNLVQRTLTPLEGNAGSTAYYLDVLRNYLSPWFFLIPFAIVLGIKGMIEKDRRSDILMLLILSTFGLYTFVVHTKLPIYVLPIFPALAVLIAQLFALSTSDTGSNYFLYLVSGGLAATLIAQNKILILLAVASVVIFLLWKTCILTTAQLLKTSTNLIFGGLFMIGALNYVQGNSRLDIWSVYGIPDQPISQIASIAGRSNPSIDEPLLGSDFPGKNREFQSRVQGPAATFYSNRPVMVADSWERLIELMEQQGSGEILIAESYVEDLSAVFEVSVIETVPPFVYARFSQ